MNDSPYDDQLELYSLTRSALLRLRDHPGLAFSVSRELIEIGWESGTAWLLVEAVLNHPSSPRN